MTVRTRQIIYNVVAFAILFLVSLYRQISLREIPDDPFRTWIIFICYIVLLVIWVTSIKLRVTQKNMRRMLMLEAYIMMGGMTVRFLQDTFFNDDPLFIRISGLCLAATLLPCLLAGLYGTLGIGKPDHYRMKPGWNVLWIPMAGFVYLIVSDEFRHFFFFSSGQDLSVSQVAIFKPSFGVLLIAIIAVGIMVVRMLIIAKRNYFLHTRKFIRWLVPLFEPVLLLLLTAEYFLVTLHIAPGLAGKEVLELFAKLYYAEVLTWEVFILFGLVPVNTGYLDIFEHAATNMQIIFDDGKRIFSKNADVITENMQKKVMESGSAETESGHKLRGFRMSEAWFFWNQDVSQMRNTISRLEESTMVLSQESILLGEELSTKNVEASLQAKNQIYDELTEEIQSQLNLMKKLIEKRKNVADTRILIQHLYIVGTYIKRRCNLSLLWKENKTIRDEDFWISMEDMLNAMQLAGVETVMEKKNLKRYTAGFLLFLFDAVEEIIEFEHFLMKGIRIEAEEECFIITITGKQRAFQPELLFCPEGYYLSVKKEEEQYQVIIGEDREYAVENA